MQNNISVVGITFTRLIILSKLLVNRISNNFNFVVYFHIILMLLINLLNKIIIMSILHENQYFLGRSRIQQLAQLAVTLQPTSLTSLNLTSLPQAQSECLTTYLLIILMTIHSLFKLIDNSNNRNENLVFENIVFVSKYTQHTKVA